MPTAKVSIGPLAYIWCACLGTLKYLSTSGIERKVVELAATVVADKNIAL